jgi:hypothetical protein
VDVAEERDAFSFAFDLFICNWVLAFAAQKRRGIWLKLPIKNVDFVAPAVEVPFL